MGPRCTLQLALVVAAVAAILLALTGALSLARAEPVAGLAVLVTR